MTEEKHNHIEESKSEHDSEHHEKHASKHESSDEGEEEIKVDFSKIKNIFKSKKERHNDSHTQKSTHHHKDEEEDDEPEEKINIDFSSIKNFFHTKQFFVILTILLILIPCILTVYIRLQPEYLPATDDWARNSVYNYYKSSISQQVNTQYPNLPTENRNTLVDQQFAQFRQANNDQIELQIKQTSLYFKTGFQYQENGQNYTFLGDLDSYYWLRTARNIETTGSPCDEIKDGKCIDNHMIAPLGSTASASMHPLGIVYLYNVLHVFNSKINLMQASFYLPTVLAVIAAIAAFFIGRRLMNDTAGFFSAMFIALSPLFITRTLGSDNDVWNIMFPLIIMWIFLEAFEAKGWTKRIILSALAGLAIGVFSYAWGGWWYIFDFIIVAIVGFIIFELVQNYLRHKDFKKIINSEVINTLSIFAILIVTTAIFTTLFVDFSNFTYAFVAPFQLSTGLKAAAETTLWPNVLTTVAELNEANISTIVNQTAFGINVLYSLALLGIVFTLVKKKPDFKEHLLIAFSIILYLVLISSSAMTMDSYLYLAILMIPVAIGVILLWKSNETQIDVKPAFLLTIWFIGMIFASIKGVRFILLLIPTFSIALGVAIGYIYQYISRITHENLKIAENLGKVIVFILLCLILIQPIQIGMAAGRSYVPSMTKGWWDSLTNIREKSATDAIINSWWDFGHWFKYVADRRVSLDGASQNHPTAHWLGRILQTNNEDESIAVLRMIDCGSNSAFDEINKKYQDTEKSQNVVQDILMLNTKDSRNELSKDGFSSDEIDKILSFTKCQAPEDYFITSEDMVGKAGVWAHFGVWDFDRAYIINNIRNMKFDEAIKVMKDRWNYSDDYASKLYYDVQTLQTDREMNDWISPWPSYGTQNLLDCSNVSDIVICPINMGIGSNQGTTIVMEKAYINMTNPKASQIGLGLYDSSNRKVQTSTTSIREIAIMDNSGNITKYPMENATISLSLLIDVQIDSNNQTKYKALIADPLLIDSTFTRLFFLDGKGTKYFEKFSDTTDITGSRIIVWKVKWPTVE